MTSPQCSEAEACRQASRTSGNALEHGRTFLYAYETYMIYAYETYPYESVPTNFIAILVRKKVAHV